MLQGVYRRSANQITAVLSVMFFSSLEPHLSYDWQLMTPGCITVTFQYTFLCVLTCVTCKLHVVYERFGYQVTPSLLVMFIFRVRASYMLQLSGYGSKHASYFSPICHLWVLASKTWKTTGRISVLAIMSNN